MTLTSTKNKDHIIAKFLLATACEKQAGAVWYINAKAIAKRIADRFDVPVIRVVGVIAALSPNNKWERNCQDAENLIAAWSAGGATDAANVKVCTYGPNKAKAVLILETAFDHESIVSILSGPKVVEFYHCILDICDDVCIDGHAYSIWIGERLTMKEVPSIGVKLRKVIKEDYRRAALAIEKLGHGYYTAAQIQAITWVAHKRIHGV